MNDRQTKRPAKSQRRVRLDSQRVATEAMALIDSEGIEGFSYRKLAKRLDCEAMSIYHYFPSKAHLMDALVDICVDETPVPSPGPTPRERLYQFGLAYRETALRHPGFTRLFITHRLNHRKALAWLNELVSIITDTGLPPERAALVFRAISHFIMGATLDETSGFARGPSGVTPVPPDEAARDFPAISSLGPYFGKERHFELFDTGLNVLLDWFDAEVAAATRPPPEARD